MHPLGGSPSDPGHRALLPFSKRAATLSLPLASTAPGRHSQTDNEHDPSPIIESIQALARPRQAPRPPAASHDVLGLDIGAGRTGSNPTPAIVLKPARGTPSSARRPDRLADYMGCCPHRRAGHMRCGTRDGRTLSRRRRVDPRLLVVRSRSPRPNHGLPAMGESGACRPAFRALGDFHRRPAVARRVVKAGATAFVGRAAGCCSKPSAPRASRGTPLAPRSGDHASSDADRQRRLSDQTRADD